jgi:mercuric ion binding protein
MLNRLLVAMIAGAALAASANEVRVTTLDVKGMDCAACPLTVKILLKKQPGVDEVKMDAQKHTAQVRFDPAKVTPDQLAKIVSDIGYPTTAIR